jgi:hypothetical protein
LEQCVAQEDLFAQIDQLPTKNNVGLQLIMYTTSAHGGLNAFLRDAFRKSELINEW